MINQNPGSFKRGMATVLLAAINNSRRFHRAEPFRAWTGLMPCPHQSSHIQRFELGVTKERPARVKRGSYQAAHYASHWGSGLGAICDRQVKVGKTHKQAVGLVMWHRASRVYTMLKEGRT